MKNIVFWMSERLRRDLFTIEQLGFRLSQALWFLKQCVTQNNLPSYMIPERNLFKGRIELSQKAKLLELLTSLIEEGPSSVFKRIDKLRGAMSFVYRAPEMAEKYRISRDIIEKIYSFWSIRCLSLGLPDMSRQELANAIAKDKLASIFSTALRKITLPEWNDLKYSGEDGDTFYENTIRSVLS